MFNWQIVDAAERAHRARRNYRLRLTRPELEIRAEKHDARAFVRAEIERRSQ